ncbi:chitin_deacetylase [Hexamita inflata]|uniref:Chitin_deacetylase n=1 Tax=Hexamita inflata TaxID=28002 RepID=A0ABP1JGJ6_9EUKA
MLNKITNDTNGQLNNISYFQIPNDTKRQNKYGFRAPFLKVNQDLLEIVQKTFLYDSSTHFDFCRIIKNRADCYFPFTLENVPKEAEPEFESIKQHKILEIPISTFIVPPYTLGFNLQLKYGKIIYGGDWTCWAELDMSAEEFNIIIRYTIECHMNGNKAPVVLGLHSDYYTEEFDTENPQMKSNYIQRQQALLDIIQYCNELNLKIVRMDQLAAWMFDNTE